MNFLVSEDLFMNILHMKYAVEVAKAGSLSKASENLLVAQPNISRSIKELEADLNITIFDRSAKGMFLTAEGEEFIGYARGILKQIESLDMYYKNGLKKLKKFSISVPRASYIAEAFANFSKAISDESVEIFYKETNSKRAINNILTHDYKLGIIRYAKDYSMYFKNMLEQKGLEYELITEFTYCLVVSKDSVLAKKEYIDYEDLADYIEIAHADPYVPSLPVTKLIKEELNSNVTKRIFVFERASQFELLSENSDTFMWMSPVPQKILDRYNLVQIRLPYAKKLYKDVLIYKNGYRLSELDKAFITELHNSKRKHM